MGNEMGPDSRLSAEQEKAPLDLGAAAGPGRWPDALPLLLVVILLLLAPVLYDLGRWLLAR